MWFGWPVKHFKWWIDDTNNLRTKNRLKSVHIKLFSEYLQRTNVLVEIRIVSRMIHEQQNGQISNKHYLQWIIQSVIDKIEFSRFSSQEMLSSIFLRCSTIKADWKTCSFLVNFGLYKTLAILLIVISFWKMLSSLSWVPRYF